LRAGDAARRIGVAVTTLRSWHQRYGLGPSAHEAGHHRRYTDDDMARLQLMQQMVAAGVTPADAARWARRTPLSESAVVAVPPVTSVSSVVTSASSVAGVSPVSGVSPGSGGPPVPGVSLVVPAPSGAPVPSGSVGGGGYAFALGNADPAARGLGRAALRLDVLGLRDLVAAAIEQRGVVDTWERVLRPVLRAVGDRAASAEEMVEVEHILSGCISAAFASLPRPPHGVPVRTLLSCANEEQHSLPIEALAAALATRGIPARVLGARVPPRALRAAIRRTGPAAVLIWAHQRSVADPAQLSGLLTGRGRPAVIAAAGPGWDRDTVPAGVVVPADLAEAVAIFAAAA
jgi:hypothetical protein